MNLFEELERTRRETLHYFGLSGDDLAKTYAPGKWSVRFILHHLCDAETVLYERIRRVISEPRQVIWAFDQDAWAKALDYSSRPLDLSRNIFDAVRAGVLHEARHHYESSGDREFVHSESGVRTLREEFDKVAGHNEQHLAQIRRALSSGRT